MTQEILAIDVGPQQLTHYPVVLGLKANKRLTPPIRTQHDTRCIRKVFFAPRTGPNVSATSLKEHPYVYLVKNVRFIDPLMKVIV